MTNEGTVSTSETNLLSEINAIRKSKFSICGDPEIIRKTGTTKWERMEQLGEVYEELKSAFLLKDIKGSNKWGSGNIHIS